MVLSICRIYQCLLTRPRRLLSSSPEPTLRKSDPLRRKRTSYLWRQGLPRPTRYHARCQPHQFLSLYRKTTRRRTNRKRICRHPTLRNPKLVNNRSNRPLSRTYSRRQLKLPQHSRSPLSIQSLRNQPPHLSTRRLRSLRARHPICFTL